MLTRLPKIVACGYMRTSQKLVFDLSALDLGAEAQEEMQEELSEYFGRMLADITLPKLPDIELSSATMVFEVVLRNTPMTVELPLRAILDE